MDQNYIAPDWGLVYAECEYFQVKMVDHLLHLLHLQVDIVYIICVLREVTFSPSHNRGF